MNINLSNAISQIEASKRYWDQAAPNLAPQENLQGLGVDVADITKSFDEVIALLRALNNADDVDGVVWNQYRGNFDSVPSSMHQFLSQNWSAPGQILGGISNICSWLWALKSSLLQLLPIHPESERSSPDFARAMTARIHEAQEWIAKAGEIKDVIQQAETSAADLIARIAEQQETANEGVKEIQALLATTQGHEREAGTAKTNAESAATTATTESSAVAKMAQELTASVVQKDALFKEFEDRRDEIAGLLENANKVGLARSFHDKRKELEKTWRVWAVAFVVGIVALVWMGWAELLPLLKTGSPDPVAVVVRFLFAGPIIWFAWFAARQYGHVLRISEDYAFKEAAAMAFAGYRNEMGGDPELLKMLQESAIRTFGANPSKMLLKRGDAASPVHELVEKALDKVKPNEIVDALSPLLKK
jgi:hypothetical protein